MATGDLEPLPRAQMRAGDADREAVAATVQEAAADGRLGLDELDERLAATYAARTFGDLETITRDLADVPAHGSDADEITISAPISDQKRSGRWRVPERINANAGMGSIKLDFTEAIVTRRVVHVDAVASAGSVVLLVPEGWQIDIEQARTAMGSVKNKVVAPPKSGAPLLRVTGRAVMGDIVIRHPRTTRWMPR